MCSESCLSFVKRHITKEEVAGRRVLEIGARDVNGTVRPFLTAFGPSQYVGTDIEAGPGVDVICAMEQIEERFGPASFDLVITTEVLEHVRGWQTAVSNLKRVCRPEGTILVTTRSFGFAYHAFPHDYWRYELADMRVIFGDCEIQALEDDPGDPGVFVKVHKPAAFREVDLARRELYSIVLNRPALAVSDRDIDGRALAWVRMREGVKAFLTPVSRERRRWRARLAGR